MNLMYNVSQFKSRIMQCNALRTGKSELLRILDTSAREQTVVWEDDNIGTRMKL